MIWVLTGCNAITESVKVGRMLFLNKLALKRGLKFQDIPGDIGVVVVAGLLAVLVVGLISIKDGTHILRRNPQGARPDPAGVSAALQGTMARRKSGPDAPSGPA